MDRLDPYLRLIRRDFADFHGIIRYILAVFGTPCSWLKVTHKLQGPQAKRSATLIP